MYFWRIITLNRDKHDKCFQLQTNLSNWIRQILNFSCQNMKFNIRKFSPWKWLRIYKFIFATGMCRNCRFTDFKVTVREHSLDWRYPGLSVCQQNQQNLILRKTFNNNNSWNWSDRPELANYRMGRFYCRPVFTLLNQLFSLLKFDFCIKVS